MKCLTFRDQFETGSELTGEFLEHRDGCAECAAFVCEEKSLTGLLSSLPKYDAPGDFGVSVRSRIAGRRPGPSLVWSTARILVPTAAMLFIVGIVFMNSEYFQKSAPEESGIAVQIEPVDDVSSGETASGSNSAKLPDEVEESAEDKNADAPEPDPAAIAATEPKIELADGGTKIKEPRDGGGILDSSDQTFEEADIANPPGLDPNREVPVRQSGRDKQFTSREILATLGLNTVWKAGRLYVVSVSRNSVGQKAGVRNGDQIVSIDGQAVSRNVAAKRRVSGQVLKVRRDGKEVQIRIAAAN